MKFQLLQLSEYIFMMCLYFCIILIIMFSYVREIALEYWTYWDFYCNRNRLTWHRTDAVFACVYALMSTMSIEWIRVPGYLFGEKCGKPVDLVHLTNTCYCQAVCRVSRSNHNLYAFYMRAQYTGKIFCALFNVSALHVPKSRNSNKYSKSWHYCMYIY